MSALEETQNLMSELISVHKKNPGIGSTSIIDFLQKTDSISQPELKLQWKTKVQLWISLLLSWSIVS